MSTAFHIKNNLTKKKAEIKLGAVLVDENADEDALYRVFLRDVDEVSAVTVSGIGEHLDGLLQKEWKRLLPEAAHTLNESYSGPQEGNWKRCEIPPMVPHTNNAIESTNKRIKADATEYKRIAS